MRPGGANALFVVRLVLRRPTPALRLLSTAVLSQDAQTLPGASDPRASSTDGSASSSHITLDEAHEFLEPPSQEYARASLTLPSRDTTPHPIPWPTLFSHPPSSSPSIHPDSPRTHRCDPLARLVASGDLKTARTVYDELQALHIGILRRSVYLSAALQSLDRTPQGKANFLFWLQLVPNRPAVRPHPSSRAPWDPVIQRLIDEHPLDVDFFSDFLVIAGKKGILPSVCGPLVRHLAQITRPDRLLDLFQKAVGAYIASTTSGRSTSVRAAVHGEFARVRMGKMYSSLARSLLVSGWRQAARELLDNPPEGVLFDACALQRAEEVFNPLLSRPVAGSASSTSGQAVPKIIRQLRTALRGPVKPSHLAELIQTLDHGGRHSLLSRLSRRFLQSRTTRQAWRVETFHHAQLLSLARIGDHAEVMRYFASHFYWLGVPDHPLKPSPTDSASARRVYPSKAVITTVLPSLLSTISKPRKSSIPAFHESFLRQARTLSPSLRPSEATHATIMRNITHLLGPDAGIEALRATIEAGMEPGLAACNALLFSLARTRRVGYMRELLDVMEREAEVDGIALPLPNDKTYLGIAGMLDKAGMDEEAEEIRVSVRAREHFLRDIPRHGQSNERVNVSSWA